MEKDLFLLDQPITLNLTFDPLALVSALVVKAIELESDDGGEVVRMKLNFGDGVDGLGKGISP